jgi:hypothetical protein
MNHAEKAYYEQNAERWGKLHLGYPKTSDINQNETQEPLGP